MNVLLIGECYSTNLGDGVICKTVGKMIQDHYPDANITYFDISGKTNYEDDFSGHSRSFFVKWFVRFTDYFPWLFTKSVFYNAYHNNEARYLHTMDHLHTILTSQKIDFAIFAGGEMFMDYFAGLIYYTVRQLSHKRIPILFHACGMEKLSANSIKLLKKAFSCKSVVSISLRDSFDQFCAVFGTPPTPINTYDTALCCSEYFEQAPSKIAEYGLGVIAIPQFFDFQTQLIRAFLDSGVSFRVFTNGSPYDEFIAKKLLRDSGCSDEDIDSILLPRPLTPDALIKNVTSFKKIISFRMHSQVIATAFGIESHGFIWDNKVKTFFEKIDRPHWCSSPDHFTLEQLLHHDSSASNLNDQVKKMQQLCRNDLIRELSQM